MSKITKLLSLVLVGVFSVMVAGAVLSGCDHGKPDTVNNPD